jgi:hypothetical protein
MAGEFTAEVRDIVVNRSGGMCEVCGDPAWDLHHRHPRKFGSTKRAWIGYASNCLAVCRMDHNLIEARRSLSYLLGWLVREGHDPSTVPVVYRGARVWLGVDGSVKETA